MEQRTHLAIDPRWVGVVEEIGEGTSRVHLDALPEMAADGRGLVHGGFTFGLADYAAMTAVNHPNVVLGDAQVRFLAPVRAGERMVARARVAEGSGRKARVEVSVEAEGREVFRGSFTTFSLDAHVLEGRG